MNYKYDSTRSVIVSEDYHWIEIDDKSPRDATVLLIDRKSGVQTKGKIPLNGHSFTHWAPLPTFAPQIEITATMLSDWIAYANTLAGYQGTVQSAKELYGKLRARMPKHLHLPNENQYIDNIHDVHEIGVILTASIHDFAIDAGFELVTEGGVYPHYRQSVDAK